MADRIGVISKGRLIVVEEKTALMKKLGKKQLTLHLQEPLAEIPAGLSDWRLALKNGGSELEYTFDAGESRAGIASLLRRMGELGIGYKDLQYHARARSRIFSSAWSASAHEHCDAGPRLQPPRRPRHLQVRDGALQAHAVAEPGDAGDHDFALFRGVRRRDRLAHGRGGRACRTAPSSCRG